MKKIIAILLGTSMVLSLAGCDSKSSETRTTRETTKKPKVTTTETDVTTEETTEETTEDTTKATTEETTEDTTKATKTTSAPDTVDPATLKGPVLDDLQPERDYTLYCYAVDNANYDEIGQAMIKMLCPCYEIGNEDEAYDDMYNAVEEFYDEVTSVYKEHYDEELADFIENARNSPEDLACTTYDYETVLFRADQQIFAFALIGTNYNTGESECITVNVDTYTLDEIELEDVITDMDAFEDLLGKYVDNKTKEDLLERLDDDEFMFGLTYDGIFVFTDAASPYSANWVKIPLKGLKLANQQFFQATPKEYTVFFDGNMDLVWDLDNDGKDETYNITSQYLDDAGGFDYKITINDKTYSSYEMVRAAFNCNVTHSYIIHTEDGDYLYLFSEGGDGYTETHIFELENGEPSFLDTILFWTPISFTYLNPSCFTMRCDYQLLGTITLENDFDVTDGGAVPVQIYSKLFSYDDPLITAVDLNGKSSLDDTVTDTIPAGSAVIVTGYSPKNSTVVLKMLNEDTRKNKEVLFELKSVDSDIDYFEIDGHLVSEAFKHIEYSGA